MLSLNIVRSAPAKGGVCLDGSAPGYYFRQGDPSRVLIGMLGGGWCTSLESCLERSQTVYGSSHAWPGQIVGMGVTSASEKANPTFHNWTIAFMWYCDGTSYSSDLVEPVVVNGSMMWFRGKRVFDAVVDDLFEKRVLGVDVKEVVLYGESAGGVGCYTHVDSLASRLQPARVRGLCDSSFFGDDNGLNGAHFRPTLRSMFTQFNLSGALDITCAEAMQAGQKWMCLFPPALYKYLSTPVFVLQSQYDCMHLFDLDLRCLPTPDSRSGIPACDEKGSEFFDAFGRSMLETMNTSGVFGNGTGNGLYTDSCIHHSIGLFGGFWNDPNYEIQGLTAAASVKQWLEDAPISHIHVDAPWPRDQNCIDAFSSCLGSSPVPWQCGPEPWQFHHCDPWLRQAILLM